MEINKFTSYCALTDLIQKCVNTAIEDNDECMYITGIDTARAHHIAEVFIDSCEFNQIEPVFRSNIPDSVITPDRVCGLSFQFIESKSDIGFDHMILTIH